MKLRLTKCSQYKKDSILWTMTGADHKCYLILSYQKPYLKFTSEKPNLSWEASGAFAALSRKHINNAAMTAILTDVQRNNIWIPLYIGGERWLLNIHHEGAVEISLISPQNESIVRLGAAGVFTKKKEARELPPFENLPDILYDELQKIQKVPSSESEKPQAVPSPTLAVSPYQKEVRKRIARRLKTVRSAFSKLTKDIHSDEEIAKLEEEAHHLQETQYNVGEKFEHIKKLKRARKALAEHVEKTGGELKDLENAHSLLQESYLTEDELVQVLKRFRLPLDKPEASTKDKDTSIPYKMFKIDGVEMLVGKGPLENDELTKAARSNDYWFHAIGLGGSHVIVPFQQLSKTGMTTKVKREASILALHYSRLRKDFGGEVYVTQRRHLTKKKGMPPGLWQVQQSESFYLSYTDEELKKILSDV